MRRMDLVWFGRVTACGALAVSACIAALVVGSAVVFASSTATAASFGDGGFGFDPNSEGMAGLPSTTIDIDPLLTIGDLAQVPGGNFDIEITGSGDMCILAPNDNVCQVDPNSITGPFSGIVTWTVSKINNPDIDGPFLLLLSQLVDDYSPSEVVIDLDPSAPPSLDASGIGSGFVFDGSFAKPTNVVDETFAFAGDDFIFNYLGWVVELGDTIAFKYDVLTGKSELGAPQFLGNAAPIPEPGTALLMALGLAGLAAGGRRRVE